MVKLSKDLIIKFLITVALAIFGSLFSEIKLWIRLLILILILPIIWSELRKVLLNFLKMSWQILIYLSLFTISVFVFWNYYLIPIEVRTVREQVLEINHLIEKLDPNQNKDGNNLYIFKGKRILEEQTNGERTYYDSERQTVIAKTKFSRTNQGLLVLEIRYYDKHEIHFLTDYFNPSGQNLYAMYDPSKTGNWEPISYPFPFIIPITMFMLRYGL